MKKTKRKFPVVLIFAVFLLSACGGNQPSVVGDSVAPSVVEPIDGSEFSRVILTEKAVERLDIQTAQVSVEDMDGSQIKTIPYSAVMYGLQGETWTYTTSPTSRIYVRQIIVIDHIEGETAILTEGPDVGTSVVTVGASLLYGAEVGVSK